MHPRKNTAATFLSVLALIFPYAAFGSPNSSLQSEINSADWHRRNQAFLEIQGQFKDAPATRVVDAKKLGALAKLLRTEINFSKTGSVDDSEEYSEYVAQLTAFVIGLHNPLFIDSLFDPKLLNTGNMVTEGIASLGDLAIPKELSTIRESSDSTTQLSATRVAMQMLEQGTLRNPSKLAALNEALLKQSTNSDNLVRICALDGLSYFHDSISRRRIEEAAATDPYHVLIDGVVKFPVREEALKIIRGKQ